MKLFMQAESYSYKHGKRASSAKWVKTLKHRVERRRAKSNPDCLPCYKKYWGYWF